MTLPGSVSPRDGGFHVAVLARQRLHQLRQSEVDDLGVAVFGHHDVGGFQVPVNDALVMGAGEPFGDLRGDLQ